MEKLCTGSFFHGRTHGQDDDGGFFQALASGKASLDACAAAAAVPQLVVVGGRGDALGLDLGASFLASRALAHRPVEQLRDLLAAPDAADRLAAAGVAVSVNLRRCPFDRRAFGLTRGASPTLFLTVNLRRCTASRRTDWPCATSPTTSAPTTRRLTARRCSRPALSAAACGELTAPRPNFL